MLPGLLSSELSASAGDWLYRFEPFSAVHVAVVMLTAAVGTLIIWAGRRWRDTPRGRRLDLWLAGAALLIWLVCNGAWLLPHKRSLASSIPIHVSDVIGLSLPLALVWGWRWIRAIVYFWGFALTTQAYITPDLADGPATAPFWMFWLAHMVILAGALYDVAVRGFRPIWRDYGVALLALVCYAAIVLPINVLLDVNYGYVGRATPDQPTLLDHLGPWPRRLLPMGALAVIALALPMLPWVRLKAGGRSHAEDTVPGLLL